MRISALNFKQIEADLKTVVVPKGSCKERKSSRMQNHDHWWTDCKSGISAIGILCQNGISLAKRPHMREKHTMPAQHCQHQSQWDWQEKRWSLGSQKQWFLMPTDIGNGPNLCIHCRFAAGCPHKGTTGKHHTRKNNDIHKTHPRPWGRKKTM